MGVIPAIFNAMSTAAQPQGRLLHVLREQFPFDADISLHTNLKLNGGNCKLNDVVSFEWESGMAVGRLLLCVGVVHGSHSELIAFIEKWHHLDSSTDRSLQTFGVREDDVVKVPAKCLDTVFTHRMAESGKSSSLWCPLECRAHIA